MDCEDIGSASRTNSKIPICNFGRGVMTPSDFSGVVAAESPAKDSKGIFPSSSGSVMVWVREEGLVKRGISGKTHRRTPIDKGIGPGHDETRPGWDSGRELTANR